VGTTAVVESARRALGPVGIFLPFSRTMAPSAELQRDAVRRLERAGYRAVWTNEGVGGKDALVQLAVLLAATERMVFGTAIANIWARSAQTAHGAAAFLAQAFPDRFVLGLGVGYPHQAASAGREFGRPVATMRGYLEQMAAPTQLPAPDVAYPKIIGANGPNMLALAGEIADGAMPAMTPPAFTAQARQVLGPDKLLVTGLAAAVDADPEQAKQTARQMVAGRLGQPGTYAATMSRLGYSQQEITEVSDRLVGDIVAHGDAAAIAAKVAEHRAAGADHVMVMLTGPDFAGDVDQLEQLGPALAQLTG
jgi:probable F420-dependent oxidoreductase